MKRTLILIMLMLPQISSGNTGLDPSISETTKQFADLYTEETGLTRAETVATYTQFRAGWALMKNWETYAAMRLGADARTVLERSDAIYNDNYAFLGAGIDYLGLLRGVRLVAQLGYSQDLSNKIRLGGWDTRLGLVTYHEWAVQNTRFHSEIYSEGLFIRRYQNVLASIQTRFFYDVFRYLTLEFAPMMNLVGAIDAAGLDYNRFAEARLGFRLKWQGPVSMIFTPYYAFGMRWQSSTELPYYQDLRGLFALYVNF